MNKISIKALCFFGILSMLMFMPGCNDFDEMNSDPTKSDTADPNSQLTYVQLLTWGDWGPCYTYYAYCGSFVQQLQGEWNTTQYGGRYRRSNEIMKYAWDRFYSYPIKNIVDVLSRTQNDSSLINVESVMRILKVHYFMTLTDLYGDVPYFDAGKGYLADVSMPAYDKQELIYKDFLNELKESENALDSEGGVLTGDIIYNGDINKWKRYANALRLRVAMRMVKVEPELAKEQVLSVLGSESGLLMDSQDALVNYLDINDWENQEFRRNALAQSWRSRDTHPSQFICSVFWNHLKNTGDPRILHLARCYEEVESAANNPFGRLDITEEIIELQGWDYFQPVDPGYFWYDKWPNGYWSDVANSWVAKACRPQVSNAFLKGNVPGVLMTYAEVQYLLAEAMTRWPEVGSIESAEQHYINGVEASMRFLSNYEISINPSDIEHYLLTNPFPADSEGRIKAINEQLWILHLNNPPEAYSNWRRTGYPALKPSGEYGVLTVDSKVIPRRLNYPLSELLYNEQALDEALQRMGGKDDWNVRMWWDK